MFVHGSVRAVSYLCRMAKKPLLHGNICCELLLLL